MAGPLDTWLKYAPKPAPLGQGQRYNVFLSYRSVNRLWVINLYDVLRNHGHQVFLDQCRMAAGDHLIDSLEQGLEASQAGVLVWSTSAADSDWVKREYQVMERRAKKGVFSFVPVRLDDEKLPLFAESRLFLDFSHYPEGPNGGELLRLLHAVVGQPLSEEAMRFAAEQDEISRRFNAQINAAIANGSVKDLNRLFKQGGLAWETSSALGCAAAEGLAKLKEYDAALTMLSSIEERFPRAIRPKQLTAHALSRRGKEEDLEQAQNILGELYALGEKDPETLGMYGRTWMDRYAISKNVLHLRRSRDLYAEGFEAAQDDSYTGINAAAKSVLLGTSSDLARAKDYAERVMKVVGTATVPGKYWETATVGEVFLIQEQYAEAAARYADAVAIAPNETGSHETTWRQACRLMTKLQPSADDRQRVRAAFEHLPDCP
jgi:hypothetical protein